MRKKEERDILGLIGELLGTREDGGIKLFLIYRALKAKNKHPEVFQSGAYIPLDVAGKFKDHIIAFGRNHGNKWAVTVAPRFLTAVIKEGEDLFGQEVWEDTYIPLPEGISPGWKDVITDQYVDNGSKFLIGEVLTHFPVTLLMKEEGL